MRKQTVLDYLVRNATLNGDDTAALVKEAAGSHYVPLTWRELYRRSTAISRALISLGVQQGDRICLVCRTRPEWVVVEMGILGAGAVTVPIFPSSLADECQHIAHDADAVLVFVEDDEQMRKFQSEKARLPKVQRVIQIDSTGPSHSDWVMPLADLLASSSSSEETLRERRDQLDGDSIFTILYTSGTTGRPKGVVITHDAMVYEAEAIVHEKIIAPDDVQLLFLPLAHSFAKVLAAAWLASRHVAVFTHEVQNLKYLLREVRPTLMAAVPRIFEEFHAWVMRQGRQWGEVPRRLIERASLLSLRHGEHELAGTSMSLANQAEFAVLKQVVFASVQRYLRHMLGGRMRLLVSGGAALPKRVAFFFRDAGFGIVEGYGLTETSAATCFNRPSRIRVGTVGQPLLGTELRIAPDGEILIKGRGLMREYWKQPTATQEAVRDGWLHTGDIGFFDADNYLHVKGRKSDIILSAKGKEISPHDIEAMFAPYELISRIVVFGQGRNFLTALVTLDPRALRRLAYEHKLHGASYASLTQHPQTFAAVARIIAACNVELPPHAIIRKFKILEHDFSYETGELTPTAKVKRTVIHERYRPLFDGLYRERY